ncbi:hypothetical protein EZV73_18695 [Acidaminobacter sp. JC074]|uniref:hypothetical protein n=1 Tax=Acidaminobacter sp. JC074 TaxID=2530199 RepID=UPI001F10D157|nr:hypothetical protein [Acidaminobacter sp. JC074]MCH4889618.1 hypothetical protein [Acidaminobacter sp. JC074]
MYYRFSKLSKTVIVINILVSLGMSLFFAYSIIKYLGTAFSFENLLSGGGFIKEDAMILTESGARSYAGILTAYQLLFFANVSALIMLIYYARTNSFYAGFASAFICMFTTFFGGISLFAAFFSKRREVKTDTKDYKGSSEWSKYIHNRLKGDRYGSYYTR